MTTDPIWTLLARKLSGEDSEEELRSIEILLKENPDIHLKIQSLTELWNEEDVSAEEGLEEAYHRLTTKLNDQGYNIHANEESTAAFVLDNTKHTFSKLNRFILAASVMAAAIAGVYFWVHNKKQQEQSSLAVSPINTISTKYGSRSKVELPDGSVVWLNSGSKLTYGKEFGVTLREVELTGEGFFDVVHNEDKPFIIHTAFFDIKDLGTQFNVKCYPEDKTTETSLIEGSVEITVKKRPDDKYILKPDEKLVLLNHDKQDDSSTVSATKNVSHLKDEPIVSIKKLTYLAKDSFSVETAWTYNMLSFEDEAFSEVAKKMERWYDRKVEFSNKKLELVHLSGAFINESLEQAMEALKYTNRFNYEIKEGRVIIF